MRRSLCLLLLAILLSGCVTPTKVTSEMQSWVGTPSSRLVNAWGPPTDSQNIGNGERVLTWRHWQVIGPNGGGYWNMRAFTVDKDGIITGFTWRGL